MPQVMNPNIRKDDSLDTLVTGLNIAANVQGFTKKNPISAVTQPTTDMDAMQRRLEKLNQGDANGPGY